MHHASPASLADLQQAIRVQLTLQQQANPETEGYNPNKRNVPEKISSPDLDDLLSFLGVALGLSPDITSKGEDVEDGKEEEEELASPEAIQSLCANLQALRSLGIAAADAASSSSSSSSSSSASIPSPSSRARTVVPRPPPPLSLSILDVLRDVRSIVFKRAYDD